MGIYIFRVTCTKCPFEGFARKGPSGSQYKIPDGVDATVPAAPAWCARCATVVDAEILPTLDDLRQELHEFERGGPRREAFMKDASGFADPELILKFTVDSLRATFTWRTMRTSAPRCLVCASDQIAYVPWDVGGESEAMSIPHPGCGGVLQFAMHSRAVPAGRFYSIEGERLEA